MVTTAALGAIVFAVSQPEVKARILEAKTLVVEHSMMVVTELSNYSDALVEEIKSSEMVRQFLPTLFGDAGTASINRAEIDVARANVRAGPSTATAVIGSLGRGSEADLLDQQEGWHLVRFGEGSSVQSGWVSSRLLRN